MEAYIFICLFVFIIQLINTEENNSKPKRNEERYEFYNPAFSNSSTDSLNLFVASPPHGTKKLSKFNTIMRRASEPHLNSSKKVNSKGIMNDPQSSGTSYASIEIEDADLNKERWTESGSWKSSDDFEEVNTKWTYKDIQKPKVFIHNYLDNILDSDSETYVKQSEYITDNNYIEDTDTQIIDTTCVNTYVLKSKEILYGTLKEKEQAYLNICESCKHFFRNEKECLNMTITLVLNSVEIKVPQLALKFDKQDGIHQSLIINYPITYILSNLMTFFVNINPYNDKQINYACDSLLTKVSVEINKNMTNLIGNLGIFNNDISTYAVSLRNIFLKSYKENEKKLWNSCTILRRAMDAIKQLNSTLLNNSKSKFLKFQAQVKEVDESEFYLISARRESNLHHYMKPIYNFVFIASNIIDEMEQIYIREINDAILKKRESLDLFYLRDIKYIKNICSIHIMTTISWFFNQINLDLFNKNKNVKVLFSEKFSVKNLKNIVSSLYSYLTSNKRDIIDLCLESMTDIIYMMNLIISTYYEKDNFFSRDNLTFSKLIKFTDIYILRHKLDEINKENKGMRTLSLNKIIPFNIAETENLVCMMKQLSNKMNFFISMLKKSYLQKLMLENYGKYEIENVFIYDNDTFFCTSIGEYLIHKVTFNNVFPIISIYNK